MACNRPYRPIEHVEGHWGLMQDFVRGALDSAAPVDNVTKSPVSAEAAGTATYDWPLEFGGSVRRSIPRRDPNRAKTYESSLTFGSQVSILLNGR